MLLEVLSATSKMVIAILSVLVFLLIATGGVALICVALNRRQRRRRRRPRLTPMAAHLIVDIDTVDKLTSPNIVTISTKEDLDRFVEPVAT
jgi:hypothetical protein